MSRVVDIAAYLAAHRAIENHPERAAQIRAAREAATIANAADFAAYLDGTARNFRFSSGRHAVETFLNHILIEAGLQFAHIDFEAPYLYCLDTRTNNPLFALRAPAWACFLDGRLPHPAEGVMVLGVSADRVAAISGEASGRA